VQLTCCPANKLGGLAKAGGPGLVTAGGAWTKTGWACPPPPGPIAGYGPEFTDGSWKRPQMEKIF